MVDVKALRPGALVRLVCGSPKMAVVSVRDTGLVEVVGWGDRIGVFSDYFPPEVLVAAIAWPREPDAPTLASPGEDA